MVFNNYGSGNDYHYHMINLDIITLFLLLLLFLLFWKGLLLNLVLCSLHNYAGDQSNHLTNKIHLTTSKASKQQSNPRQHTQILTPRKHLPKQLIKEKPKKGCMI